MESKRVLYTRRQTVILEEHGDMPLPVALVSIRLFVRLLLGCILLSVGVSKLVHPRQFQQGIQDYHLVPPLLEKKLAVSALLAMCFPIAELLAGIALVTGFWLTPATILALTLFAIFSVAIIINLARDRHDLSCHCGGATGNHPISWWLVGRNGLLICSLLVLLVTPPDLFTVPSFVRSPSLLNPSFVSIIVPVAVLVGAVVAAIVLFNAARVLWRS